MESTSRKIARHVFERSMRKSDRHDNTRMDLENKHWKSRMDKIAAVKIALSGDGVQSLQEWGSTVSMEKGGRRKGGGSEQRWKITDG